MTTYYTDGLTYAPFSVLFRLTWKNPLIFVYIAIRKLLNMPFAADMGIARVESLCELEWDQIPDEARREIKVRVDDFVRLGLRIAFCAKGAYIGNKRSYGVTLIDQSGTVYATVAWIWVRVGTLERTGTATACNSRLTDGRGIHTSAGGDSSASWFRFMVPPEEDMELHPPDTSTSAILARHRERIAGLGAVVTMSDPMLRAEILNTSRRIIDHAVRLGVWAPLSQEDVDRLRRIGG